MHSVWLYIYILARKITWHWITNYRTHSLGKLFPTLSVTSVTSSVACSFCSRSRVRRDFPFTLQYLSWSCPVCFCLGSYFLNTSLMYFLCYLYKNIVYIRCPGFLGLTNLFTPFYPFKGVQWYHILFK